MLIFVCIASTAVLSNSALGNPIPEDPLLYSDFPSENTVGFNDFETSSPIIPLDLTTHTPESSDLTFQQPLETSWLADSSAPPPDTTQLFADFSSNMPLETSLFAESSDAFLESSCGAAAEGGFQPYSKRDDDGICTTPKAEVNPMPVLKLPDLDILEKTVGSGQEELPRLRSFYIPRIPGFTVNDDDLCPKPNRRLCCQGPLTTSVSMGIVLGDCRDFGPWPCPARYDACCEKLVGLELPNGNLVASGYGCSILSENPNGIEWEGGAGQAPPPW